MKAIRVVFVCFALLAALTACGGEDEEPQATASTTDQASATPEPTPCSVADASEDAKRVESNVEVALLTEIRQTSEGCPRVVFEFRDSAPGYVVEYADPPFAECGSGAAIDTGSWGADSYLRVLLQPASGADLSAEAATPTYDGPTDIPVDGEVLKHMKRSCDFEAQIEWIVGLDGRHDFNVRALTEPPRIVIDISQSA